MTGWQDRAWELAELRRMGKSAPVPGPAPAEPVVPFGRWQPPAEHRAVWELARAGLLGGSVVGPEFVGKPVLGVCPVCSGPTAVGWWSKDDETGEWCSVVSPPTHCTACRARVIASAARDG